MVLLRSMYLLQLFLQDLYQQTKRKYPNHEYFTQPSVPSDRSIVSIGKMLYPDEPADIFFPSNVNKPIEPISRAHEKFRTPGKTPGKSPLKSGLPQRTYYPDSAQSRFTPSHSPSSFAGTIPVPVKAPEFSWGIGNLFLSAKKYVFGSLPTWTIKKCLLLK